MRGDYSDIPMTALVDLLAQETEKFTHLLASKQFSKEYEDSKKRVHKITAAIENHPENSRSKQNRGYNNSDPSSWNY